MTKTEREALEALRQKATPGAEWQDGGDGVLFGHSADESGVWHEGDSALACAAVNALPALLADSARAERLEQALRIARSNLGRPLDPIDLGDVNAEIDAALGEVKP